MKKILDVYKLLMLTILLSLGFSTNCYADMIVYPHQTFVDLYASLIIYALFALIVALFIGVICLINGYLYHDKNYINTCKKIVKKIFFYTIFTLCFLLSSIIFSLYFIYGIFAYTASIFILFTILREKNNKKQFIKIAISLTLVVLLFVLIFIFLPENDFLHFNRFYTPLKGGAL